MSKAFQIVKTSFPHIASVLLLGTAALLPLLQLPLTDNFVLESKTVAVFGVALIIFALWSIFTFTKKSLQLTISPFFLPAVLLGVSTVASIVINRGYLIEQFVGLGGVYLSMMIIMIFGSSLLLRQNSRNLVVALGLASAILAVAAIAETTGFGPSRFFNLVFKSQLPSSPIFSLAGSPLVAAEIMFVTVVGIAATLLFGQKGKKVALPLYILLGVISLAGIAVTSYTVISAQNTNPVFLPFGASWSIAIDTLKTPLGALFGFGPERYSHAYLAFKPEWMNMTPLWNLEFKQSSNVPFTLLSTIGLVGVGSWVFLIIQALRQVKKSSAESIPAMAVFFAIVVVQLLLPPNIILLIVQALAVAFWVAAEKDRLKDVQLHAFTVHIVKSGNETQRIPQHSHVMVNIMTVLNLAIVVILGYLIGRHTLSQVYAFKASYAAASNDAVGMYEGYRQAVIVNPYIDTYREKYSSSSLFMAVLVSNTPDVPQSDKEKALPLVQQSIAEAKAAIALDVSDSGNWVNLARIYNQLVGSVESADQWARDTYLQALAFAPNDPILHLELGDLYYKAGAYPQAAELYERARSLKTDLPDAYYRLATTFKQVKNYSQAVTYYQETIRLLPSDNQNYSKIQAELDEVTELAKTQTGQPQSETPTTPATATKPSPTPVAKPETPPAELIAPTGRASSSPELSEESKAALNSNQEEIKPPATNP